MKNESLYVVCRKNQKLIAKFMPFDSKKVKMFDPEKVLVLTETEYCNKYILKM